MKLLFFGLLLASASAFAGQTPAQEISARSGLPASEVDALLSDCDANQTSMNFCAWRDQLVAERELQQVVDRQSSEHPERKAALDAKMAKWRKARDASCQRAARKEWGNGSMRPAAQAVCATAATKKMTKRLSATSTRNAS
ncbi:lysozyme inhibitor LprI family protein [Burkholderia guangdongensis]|uniref:lysozyme inhibitor LprI family protein n=1 Tax=Burkholderia guangdongensis TaxID=1792500 RepID=UPI0015C97962|nr:lysozyme inhibitor LprI family protein [Burkholderia guangdongensis]